MKILDRDHAQNWAAKHLKYPFVLVDEDGNIHCLTKVADAVAVRDQKIVEGKTLHVVKGKLPDPPAAPAPAIETPTEKPQNPKDAAK